MKRYDFDIDIDIRPSDDPAEIFRAHNITRASRFEKGRLVPHQSGYYFQNIPRYEINGLSAIPYKNAGEYGYIKFDFLNLGVLELFESKEELVDLANKEPDWNLFEDEEIVSELFQLKNQFDFVKAVKPRSVIELAEIIALCKPSKKKYISSYLKDKDSVRSEIFKKEDGIYMKKGHAVSYALTIIAHLNKLVEK